MSQTYELHMSANRDHVHVAGRSLFQDVDPMIWFQALGPEIETWLPYAHAQILKTWFLFPEGRAESDHLSRALFFGSIRHQWGLQTMVQLNCKIL